MKTDQKTNFGKFRGDFLVLLGTLLFVSWFFLSDLRSKPIEKGFSLEGFSCLPIKSGGRKKPIDTFARNLLSVVSGRVSVREGDRKISAVEWLLENISNSPSATSRKVFRIENLDLLSNLGLPPRKGFRYSWDEVSPVLDRLNLAVHFALEKKESERDLFDQQVLKVYQRINLYENAMDSFRSRRTLPSTTSLPLVLPPTQMDAHWRPLAGASGAPAVFWQKMLQSFRLGNVASFNQALLNYQNWLRDFSPGTQNKLSFELFYNQLNAFMKSAELYLLAFFMGLLGWLFRRDRALQMARLLMLFAFLPHSFALVARVFLSGYPPVTNLYSSAIFIGWAAVFLGLFLEFFARKTARGLGLLIGSSLGFSTLLIAYFLAGDGDTLEQMRAVLDARFWLTTHVITISLGYMASFFAGGVAGFYLLLNRFTHRIDPETEAEMDRMVYGIICFALLFSFLGTVLGGLWADDSWGRFWGWDPKENGALMIVLWNAVMLHARSAGMVRARGFAEMAVFGNIVTAWSWFGVNQLGVGLHSYGFTDSATLALTVFVLSQAILMALGWTRRAGKNRPQLSE
jgi:ABC-type transport system involved in cytochrome c biogenesis permease subunit